MVLNHNKRHNDQLVTIETSILTVDRMLAVKRATARSEAWSVTSTATRNESRPELRFERRSCSQSIGVVSIDNVADWQQPRACVFCRRFQVVEHHNNSTPIYRQRPSIAFWPLLHSSSHSTPSHRQSACASNRRAARHKLFVGSAYDYELARSASTGACKIAASP